MEYTTHVCDICKGDKIIYSGIYAHPETGGSENGYDKCYRCGGVGYVYAEVPKKEIKDA